MFISYNNSMRKDYKIFCTVYEGKKNAILRSSNKSDFWGLKSQRLFSIISLIFGTLIIPGFTSNKSKPAF